MNIAIIGAGFSGLSAAYNLNKHGFECDVFEARNRVSGRVWSGYHGSDSYSSVIEFGGQNITDGGDAANLLALAAELNLTIDTREVELSAICHYNGENFVYYELLRKLSVTEIHSNKSSIGEIIDEICPVHALNMAIKSVITSYEGVDVYNQSIYHNIDTLRAVLNGDITSIHFDQTQKHHVILSKQIRGGNALLAEGIARQLKGQIHFGKVLTGVHKSENAIRLKFRDGEQRDYDHVIMAVPATIYKSIAFDGFERPMCLDYGHNYKVIMPEYSKRQWRSFITEYGVSFYNFYETIPQLYLNKDCDIASLVRLYSENMGSSLRKVTFDAPKDRNFALYQGVVYHKWHEDEFALGSYSGYSLNHSEDLDELVEIGGIQFKRLFAPQSNLIFAGEHTTTLECIGTMEAAVESGIRASRYILNPLIHLD